MPAASGPASDAPINRPKQEQQEQQPQQDDLGLLPVVKFLQSALAMKSKGDGLHYQHLVAQLLTRDDPETLWRLYLGLAQCVTIISQQPEEFKELIDALFRFDWSAGSKVVAAFGNLLSHLVSANGTCMVPAMHMLVRKLVLLPQDMDAEGDVHGAALTRQQHVHAALQTCLGLVPSGRSKLFGVLRQHYPHRRLRAEALSDYALQALRVVQYAPLIEENVVRLIVEKSLEIDVEIKIMDTGEAVVDEEDEEGDALFTMDDLVDGIGAKKKENTDQVDEMAEKLDGVMLVLFTYLDQRLTARASLPILNASTNTQTPHSTTGSAGDADAAIGQCEDVAAGGFARLPATAFRNSDACDEEPRSSGGEQGQGQDVEPVARLLQSLLVVFEENILPTHRSKFVQFVLFFACGRAPVLGHALVRKLLDALHDDSRPKLTRQSGVAYLASFLARASYMEASMVSGALGALLEWAQSYLDQHEDAAGAFPVPQSYSHTPGPKDFQTPVVNRCGNQPKSWHGTGNAGRYGGGNVSSSNRKDGSSVMTAGLVSGGSSRGGGLDHILFYSVCQATFYITCFRGLDIAAMDAITDHAAIWERLLTCSLYPLRHCLDTVRREFARLCCSLMEEHLAPALVDHLQTIAQERPQVIQTITVGSSFASSTPRSSTNLSMSCTPARVTTKAGGLGRGSNPLDSFFPFDPYLLRRSHVYVDGMYNTWKSQDDKATAERCRRTRRPRTSSTTVLSESDSVSSQDEDDGDDSSSVSSGDAGDIDDNLMDAQSLSMRTQAVGISSAATAGLKARARARRKAKRALSNGKRLSGEIGSCSSDDDDNDIGNGDQSDLDLAVSQKLADACILTESMSVTPASSVAVGSLMGRSLGNAMASSFADDGLVWGRGDGGGGGGRSVVEDSFFHQNVSPSASPPMGSMASSSGMQSRSGSIDISSRRALF